jgi:phosphatidylinositol dimannoside acyltransferase
VAGKRLINTAFGAGWMLVCRMPECCAAGAAMLAVRTGAALIPAWCWFAGDTEWAACVHDEIPVPGHGNLTEKVALMMQQLATVFEQAIREHPEDWHMLQPIFVADLDAERLKATGNTAGDHQPRAAGT